MSKDASVFRQRQDEIENSLLTIQRSIDFWEARLDELVAEINEQESADWSPEKDSKLESLYKECETWMKRGKIERDAMSALEVEMTILEQDMVDFVKTRKESLSKKLRITVNLKI
tara:strand:- start:3671 stop:4015 length:345 start_codon:yes stop_codon:yes gene_type:complete